MQKSNWEKRNTVESKNQVSKFVKFEGDLKGGPRILFLGNSITWHGPLEEIGWSGDWGMAASSEENDYAHKVMAAIKNKNPNATFCIVQGAVWERTYKNCDYENNFGAAKNFCPDIIVCLLSDNMKIEEFDESAFIENMGKLHSFLSGGRNDVTIIETSSFGSNEIKDKAIEAYTKKVGARYIYIGDLNKDPKYLATGLFWHDGVAGHPGDFGMQTIANRIIDCINENNMI